MNLDEFKQEYPSATEVNGTITLSQEDYDKLLESVGVAAPERVKSFFYQGYQIEVGTVASKKT